MLRVGLRRPHHVGMRPLPPAGVDALHHRRADSLRRRCTTSISVSEFSAHATSRRWCDLRIGRERSTDSGVRAVRAERHPKAIGLLHRDLGMRPGERMIAETICDMRCSARATAGTLSSSGSPDDTWNHDPCRSMASIASPSCWRACTG